MMDCCRGSSKTHPIDGEIGVALYVESVARARSDPSVVQSIE